MILIPIVFIVGILLIWWIAALAVKLLTAIVRRLPVSLRARRTVFVLVASLLVTPTLPPPGVVIGLVPFGLEYAVLGRQVLAIPFYMPLTFWPFFVPTALFFWWLAHQRFVEPAMATVAP